MCGSYGMSRVEDLVGMFFLRIEMCHNYGGKWGHLNINFIFIMLHIVSLQRERQTKEIFFCY